MQKNLNIEKIIFKVVQIMFLAMHINNKKLSLDIFMIGQYLKIWNLRMQKNINIEKIIFKVVQIKFLAMHITNQKLCFDIFTVRNGTYLYLIS